MKGNPSPRRDRSGMTLLEVMLAVVILGAGLVVLVTAASRCLAAVKAARIDENTRRLVSQVELENPLIPNEDFGEGSKQGRFTGDFRDYSWRQDIEVDGEEEDGIYRITTRVTWSLSGKKSFEEVVTYLYAPKEEEIF